jgi:CHASE3 domain sensor protein
MVALGFMVLAGASALTAKETKKYTLKELDEVQQSERETSVLTAAAMSPSSAARGLAG